MKKYIKPSLTYVELRAEERLASSTCVAGNVDIATDDIVGCVQGEPYTNLSDHL